MKYVNLLCFIAFATISFSQCPVSLTGGVNGSKDCIQVTWNAGEVPSPLPSPITFNGQSYTLESAAGSNPADYKNTGSNCSGVLPGNAQSGTLTYGSESCEYIGGTLPVTFGDISIEQDDGIIIHWSTKSELNNDYFSIERSKDGNQWIEIGTIDGSGTSQLENEYSYWDSKPLNGISHYRVKQVDFDDSFSYSDIVSYTNPLSTSSVLLRTASEKLIIDNEDEHKIYTLRNMSGQIILRGKLNEGRNLISIPELQPGVHIVTISGIITQSFKVVSY